MNYRLAYTKLVQGAKNRELSGDGYVERHHILPKALGGRDTKENLVFLTAREHFIAHMLLAKIHGGGMWQAAVMMKTAPDGKTRYLNGRLYEIARRRWAEFLRGKKRPPHVIDALRRAASGRRASPETRAKMSAIRAGKPRAGHPDNWKHSDAAKKKMSESRIGKLNHMLLPEHRERMRGDNNPMKKEENKRKISVAKKAYWAARQADRNYKPVW